MGSELLPLSYSFSSIHELPVDVLQYRIFSQLSLSSLMTSNLVCRQWRTIVERCSLFRLRNHNNQIDILLSLFRDGVSVECLHWFESKLHFPTFQDNERLAPTCVSLAAN